MKKTLRMKERDNEYQNVKRYYCAYSECDTNYASMRSLKNHMKNMHENPNI